MTNCFQTLLAISTCAATTWRPTGDGARQYAQMEAELPEVELSEIPDAAEAAVLGRGRATRMDSMVEVPLE